MGLCIVYIHTKLSGAQDAIEDSENEGDTGTSPDVWKTFNCSAEDDKITVTKTTCASQPKRLLHLLTHERIGRGQHSMV